MMLPLATLFGPENWIIILVVGLLLFGRRLPEVGRSVGRSIVEFKKGLNGIEDEVDLNAPIKAAQNRIDRQIPPPTASIAPGYKFDPYTGQPIAPLEPVAQPAPRFDPYTGKPLNGAQVDQAADQHVGV